MARLNILTQNEYELLYALPDFTDEERQEAFSLDEDDFEYMNGIKDSAVKIHYILQMGYFKAKRLFFKFTFHRARPDVRYIIRHNPIFSKIPGKIPDKKQILKNQRRILEKCGCSYCSASFLSDLRQQAELLAKRDVSSGFIFDELLCYIQRNNVVLPGYSSLQKIISSALKHEQNRLCNKMKLLLDKGTNKKLREILKRGDLFYQLTLLKKEPKDFTKTELIKEVKKLDFIKNIFIRSKEIIPGLDISNKNICYYAQLAQYYTVYKLGRMPFAFVRLYLLCFVYHRFKQINDSLVMIFIYRVNKYVKDAEDYCRQKVLEEFGNDEANRKTAGKLLNLFPNRQISDSNLRLKAFEIIDESKFKDFAKKVAKPLIDKNQYTWDYYQSISRGKTINIRPLFSAIEFFCNDNKLKDALDFIRSFIAMAYNTGKKLSYSLNDVPVNFFPANLKRYICEKLIRGAEKKINIDKYEFLIYLELKKALESGKVFVKDSINYYQLEDELIPKNIWDRDEDKILDEIDCPILKMPIEKLLEENNEALTEAYKRTNENIESGTNSHIKLNRSSGSDEQMPSWKLPYRKEEDGVNNPFYDKIPMKNLSEVLKFVSEHTSFTEKFTHIQPKYCKKAPKGNALGAALIAKGTGMGIIQMAEICDISESALRLTENSYMQFENIREANVLITNSMAKLPIFEKYTLADYGIHASIDGQKFETKSGTIKARHSPKYFGLKRVS